jgi:hypothetical protein
MDTTSSTRSAWVIFLLSTLAMIAFLIFMPNWFWVTLPFVFTYLAKAFDAI